MTLSSVVASAVAAWSAFYDDHHLVSVSVRYLHLLGLVVGGGAAISADRQLLASGRAGAAERARLLASLAATHRVVVPAVVLVVLTGVLLTAADLDTFLASRLYWTKIGLVALFILNGAGLMRAERAAARDAERGFRFLRATAALSLALWLGILMVGVWLTVAA